MNKKILLGSIVSVVILILVSFTSVIGYRSVESDVKISPLFNIRSSKAIGKESKDIACDYIGKGAETNLYLSSRKKRTEQVQKTIDIISKMDDKAFSYFVSRIILHLKSQEYMTDKETSDILQALYHIRVNPNNWGFYDNENNPELTLEYLTCLGPPGCIIGTIWSLLVLIFFYIAGWISMQLTCSLPCATIWCTLDYTYGECCNF
jgi:hypothetical protein